MDASSPEQVLEHQLERRLDFIALTVFLQRIQQRDVDIADQPKVAETVAGIADSFVIDN